MAHMIEKGAAKVAGKIEGAKARISGQYGILRQLQAEHGEVAALIESIRSSSDPIKKAELLITMRTELLSHAKAEEKEFYFRLEQYDSTRELATHAAEEHDEMEALLAELSTKDSRQAGWDDSFEELAESIEQHVAMEENELFPLAEEVLGRDEIDKLEALYKDARSEEKQMLH